MTPSPAKVFCKLKKDNEGNQTKLAHNVVASTKMSVMIARGLRARTLDLAKDAVRVDIATAHAPQHEGQPAEFHCPFGVPRGAKGSEQLL